MLRWILATHLVFHNCSQWTDSYYNGTVRSIATLVARSWSNTRVTQAFFIASWQHSKHITSLYGRLHYPQLLLLQVSVTQFPGYIWGCFPNSFRRIHVTRLKVNSMAWQKVCKQGREGCCKCEGKYTKPHPCNCSVKRCRDMSLCIFTFNFTSSILCILFVMLYLFTRWRNHASHA